MTWIIIAALVTIFIVGYRILTSDMRKAIDSLARFLKIKPLLVESMIQEMGDRQGQKLVRALSDGYTEEVRKAAYLLFIYQTFVKDPEEHNVSLWRQRLLRAGLSPLLSAEHTQSALFYFTELELDAFELAQFRRVYNERFNQEVLEQPAWRSE